MTSETLLGIVFGVCGGGISGYLLGRYQSKLIQRIEQLEKSEPEKTKPAVTPGVYKPAKDVGTDSDPKQKAGIVETKTPQMLDWENNNELAELEHS